LTRFYQDENWARGAGAISRFAIVASHTVPPLCGSFSFSA
jgi:hypothetical protein